MSRLTGSTFEPAEPVPTEGMNNLPRDRSDVNGSAATRLEPAKLVPAHRPRPKPVGPSRTIVIGQVGILLITLGLMFTFGVFLSVNFSDPSEPNFEIARQIIRVIGTGLLVAGLFLIGFLTSPSRTD
ncbi:MAG: hypothetical protein M1132_12100 [Chloroflexi bacterium]|nr:hypothetical protein [Chloroflexota bacterium]